MWNDGPMIPFTNIPQTISNVPFYSQFHDITAPKWQKVGCGITSLAMVIDFYNTENPSVNTLLKQGIALGAYSEKSGWIYKGLIQVAQKYNLTGTTFDLGTSSSKVALAELTKSLEGGPVIASVHYKLDPKNPIPHLIVIDGISDGTVYYNDPAAKNGQKEISMSDFTKAWKKRFIVIRPAKKTTAA